jgi:hypothetical protein
MKFFIYLLIYFLIMPGLMFILGLIGESRIIPLFKHQSKAFFPGEIALVVAVTSMSVYWDTDLVPKAGTMWWLLFSRSATINGKLSFVIEVVKWIIIITIYLYLEKRDHKAYRFQRSINGPAKRWHDCYGFLVIPAAMIKLGIPVIIPTEINIYSIITWASLAFYGIMLVWDYYKPATEEDKYIRHPDDWKPIWETKRLKKYDYTNRQ